MRLHHVIFTLNSSSALRGAGVCQAGSADIIAVMMAFILVAAVAGMIIHVQLEQSAATPAAPTNVVISGGADKVQKAARQSAGPIRRGAIAAAKPIEERASGTGLQSDTAAKPVSERKPAAAITATVDARPRTMAPQAARSTLSTLVAPVTASHKSMSSKSAEQHPGSALIDGEDATLNEEPLKELPGEGLLSISGRVLSDSGEPMASILVSVRARRLFADQRMDIPQTAYEQSTVSDFEGQYQFDQLPDGEYEIKTPATGRYPQARTVVRAGTHSADLVLVEQWLLEVYGVVTGSGDERLEGVRVIPSGRGAKSVSTDAGGGYALPLEIKGDSQGYLLRYQRSGFREQRVRLERSDWQDFDRLMLDVAMEPAEALATVSGIIKSKSGEPLAGETVSLYSHQLGSRFQGGSNQAGEFVIHNVEAADDYRVEVRPRSPYRDYKQQNLAVTAEGVALDIVLQPVKMASVAGQMLDLNGNSISKLSLWLRGQDAYHTTVQVAGDEQGYFVADDAPDGRLVFETRSFPKLSVMGMQVESGEEAFVDLVLDWGDHELTGRVLDEAGIPLALPRIMLTWSHSENGLHSSSLRKTASDAAGYFEFSGLGPGRHKITIDAPGFERIDRELQVGVGANVIELQLETRNSDSAG